MSTIERIQELLDCAVRVPVRDSAGIISPAGVDATVEVKTLKKMFENRAGGSG